jgi:CheY-like chemotaxis protein
MIDISAKKIILIEDEADIRMLYREVLCGAGYRVEDAADGITGSTKLKTGQWDLLLLDIMLPGKDGIKILKEIKANPNVKKGAIVALSNLNSDAIIKEAFSEGIDGYLIKSEMTPDKLIEEVNGFLK